MNLTDFMWGLGDFLEWTVSGLYDNVGNMFNNLLIVLGFVGLFIWLNKQRKFNAAAESNPDQIK